MLADRFNRLRDKSRAIPILFRPADAEDKIAQDIGSAIRMVHFGMKLHAVKPRRGIFDSGYRIVRPSGHMKSSGQADDVIPMAIPDAQLCGNSCEELGIAFDIQLCTAVFTTVGAFDFSAKGVREPLHAVADAEDRYSQLQRLRIAQRGVLVIHRARAARQHDPYWFLRANLREAGRARKDRGKHLLLADAAGDQLSVLAAKIQHDDSVFRAHHASVLSGCRCGSGIWRHYLSVCVCIA